MIELLFSENEMPKVGNTESRWLFDSPRDWVHVIVGGRWPGVSVATDVWTIRFPKQVTILAVLKPSPLEVRMTYKSVSVIGRSPYFHVDTNVEVNQSQEWCQASHKKFIPPTTKSYVIFIFSQRCAPEVRIVIYKLQQKVFWNWIFKGKYYLTR